MKGLAILFARAVAATDAGWQWVPIQGSKCMDGKETGVYVRKSTSGKKSLGVYLNGGGACFEAITCATAAASPTAGEPGSSGIFDLRSDNPLADYNWMAVPYCTGDVHGGDITKIFEWRTRSFNGAPNLKLMMSYATQIFKNVDTLFITGESAGGFGSLTSYATIRDYYPGARGVLMDDSGPVLDDEATPACLQEMWRQAWNLNKNLPTECACNNDQGNLAAAWSYLPKKYPKDSFSLISSENDATISTFFAFSNDNCHAILPIGYNKLHDGLVRLAKTTPVYIIPGSTHTHTSSDEFFSRAVNGVKLNEWIGHLIDPHHPDPGSVQPAAFDYMREVSNRNVYNESTQAIVV